MNDVERILEKFANMPLRDFLETVRLQQQRNNNLEDKIKVLQSRLSNSIDLVCIFQKKEEKIIADNRLLLRDNVNLSKEISKLQSESETESETESEEEAERRCCSTRAFDNLKITLEEKLAKIKRMVDGMVKLKIKIKELEKENNELKKYKPFVFKAPPLLKYVPNKNEKYTPGSPLI